MDGSVAVPIRDEPELEMGAGGADSAVAGGS
jgi:hypothetical protein